MLYTFAPLEGITNRLYRSQHAAHFAPLHRYYTPFFVPTTHEGLSGRDLRELPPVEPGSLPLVPQLLTNNSEAFCKAASVLKGLGYAEVNLNLGCPSGTVVSKGKGAGQLEDLETLEAFLTEIFARSALPISIKTRIGLAQPEEFAAILQLYKRFPLKELIIHPRVRKEYYKGLPHRDIYEGALSDCPFPISYSGDLFTAAQIARFEADYPQTHSLMLGRGLIANPALHEEAQGMPPLTVPRLAAFHQGLLEAYREKLSGPAPVLHKMKELWFYMQGIFPGSEKQIKAIRKAQTIGAYEGAVATLLRDCPLEPKRGYGAGV